MAEVASAYVSLLPSAKGFGKKLGSQVDGETKSAGKKLGAGFGKIFAVGAGLAAGAGLTSFFKTGATDARNYNKAFAATEQIIKATGGAANVTAEDVGKMSGRLEALSGVDDEVIQKSANLLLTFKNVRDEVGKGNDMFTRANEAALDLAAAGFGSVESQAKTLGKALNDPLKGISALTRSGVTFTEQQKEQIAALVETGDTLKAQKIIMREVEAQVGGVAASQVTAADRAAVAWDNLRQQVGNAVLPAIDKVAGVLADKVIPAVSNFVEGIEKGEGVGGRIADAWSGVSGVVGDVAPKLRTIAELSWGKLEGGASALINLAKTSWGKLTAGIDAIEGLVEMDAAAIGTKLGEAVRSALDSLVSLGSDLGKKLGEMFGKVDWVGLGIAMGKQVPALLVGLAAGILAFDLGSLLSGLADNWGTILIGIITIAFAPARVVGALAKILTKIPFVGPFIARGLTWFNEIGRAFAKRVIGFIGDLGRSFTRGFGGLKIPGAGLVKNVLGAFKAIPGRVSDFFDLLKTRIGVWALDAFEAMGKGARTAVGGALKFIGGIPGMILRSLGSLARTLSPRGFELIAGLLQAAKARFVSVATYIGAIPGRLLGALGDLGSLFYNKGAELISGLTRGISAKMTDAINAVKAGLDRIKGMLPGSPIKWGPLKNWNNGGAGKRLMDLVAKGITAATPKTVKAAQAAFEKIGDALKAERDKLRSTLDGLKGDFASLADSVSSAFTGDLFGVSAIEADDEAGIAGRTVGQSFVDNLLNKKGELTGLMASFKTLQGWGIDPGFLSQLFASGNGALITELAGMGQEGATGAANLFGEVTNLGAQLGDAVAKNDPVADRIDETNRLLEQVNKQLSFLGSDIGQELNQAASKAQRDKKKRGKK